MTVYSFQAFVYYIKNFIITFFPERVWLMPPLLQGFLITDTMLQNALESHLLS